MPKRRVVERSIPRLTRCRRLVKNYERYAQTLAGFHVIAFACLMLKRATDIIQGAQRPIAAKPILQERSGRWQIALARPIRAADELC